MPGVQYSLANDFGNMAGGPPRAVWHTTESSPGSGAMIVNYLHEKRYEPHLVWDPYTGQIWQLIRAFQSARALKNLSGGVETNRQGSVCIQIETVGQAADHPLRTSPLHNANKIMAWLGSLGIPNTWPGGSPLPYPASYGANGDRSVAQWGRAGHFGHSQVPENDHGDPGTVDVLRLTPPAAPGKLVVAKTVVRNVVRKGQHNPYRQPQGFVHIGMTGDGVRWVQWAVGATPDGVFGPHTHAAVQAWQSKHRLSADGVVGPYTRGLMAAVTN